jgi:hypothetical protein
MPEIFLGKMGIESKFVRELPTIDEAYEGMMLLLRPGNAI